MKVLISLFILLSASLFAQDDCSNWIKKHEDKVGGKSYLTNKEPMIVSDDGSNGFAIIIMESNKSIILSIKAIAVGTSKCIEEKAKVQILFTDGSRIEILTDNDFNCKADATIYFLNVFGKRDAYNELTTKDIDIMRVWASKGYVEQKFTAEQSKQFRNTLKCVKSW